MATDVQDGHVTLRGLTFHYRDWGGEGQPLVLLHGLASSCRTWDFAAPMLRDHFRVFALDQRGHGASAKCEDGYNFDNFTEDVRSFLASQEIERPLLVGHSWGASVVLEYGARHSQDLAGIVMLDGGFGGFRDRPGTTWEEIAERLAPPDLTSYTPDQLMERIRSRGSTPWTPEREAILMFQFDVTPRGTVTPRLTRENHMRILWALWENSGSEPFPKVRCPVLIMPARQRGEGTDEERLRRKEEGVARAAQLLPSARTVWMEDSVHDVQIQRPQTVAQTIIDAFADGFFPG